MTSETSDKGPYRPAEDNPNRLECPNGPIYFETPTDTKTAAFVANEAWCWKQSTHPEALDREALLDWLEVIRIAPSSTPPEKARKKKAIVDALIAEVKSGRFNLAKGERDFTPEERKP